LALPILVPDGNDGDEKEGEHETPPAKMIIAEEASTSLEKRAGETIVASSHEVVLTESSDVSIVGSKHS